MKNLRLVASVLLTSLLSASAMAAQADKSGDQDATRYTYDMPLDVQRVISVKSDPWACGIVPAEMRYEDSQGQTHDVEYSVLGQGCNNGG